MTMTRHEGGECRKGFYHEPPCSPPIPGEIHVTPDPSVKAQNHRGEWVPTPPEPLWVGRRLRKAQCDCARVFPDRDTYRGHYALVHILGL